MAACMSACTGVRISNAEVSERVYPGLTILQIAPGVQGASYIETRGLGFVFGLHSATLGALEESVFIATDASRCRTLIVVQNDRQFHELMASLRRESLIADLCVATNQSTQ